MAIVDPAVYALQVSEEAFVDAAALTLTTSSNGVTCVDGPSARSATVVSSGGPAGIVRSGAAGQGFDQGAGGPAEVGLDLRLCR